MITLVTGGSKCGKSSYAENILENFEGRKIYIATMMPFGDEAHQAIERHRKMREKKRFSTVEKYTSVHEVSGTENCAVLLECIGNLCANEMFSGEKICDPAEKIISGLKALSEKCEKLVIVTNRVGSDGITYPYETQKYIEVIGKVNAAAASMADEVVECVYGIPLKLKGGEKS